MNNPGQGGPPCSSRDGWKKRARLLFSVTPSRVVKETPKKTTPAAIKETRNPFRLNKKACGFRTMAFPPQKRNMTFMPTPTTVEAIAP